MGTAQKGFSGDGKAAHASTNAYYRSGFDSSGSMLPQINLWLGVQYGNRRRRYREKTRMDWISLVLGIVVGSCVTSALVWSQRGTARQAAPSGYFAQVALSVVVTALLAGAIRMGIEYMSTGSLSATGAWLGTGWLLGGLVAGWFVSGAMQRD
jgi:hypothetical protein